jgi:hypothetical protein
VLIGKVTRKAAFLWEDWAPETPYEQRHGVQTNPETGRPEETPWRPLQSKIEMREFESYEDPDWWEKWLLERWFPASIEISREEWFAPHLCVNGNPDLPKLGPYPNEGRYHWCCGPFDQPPSFSFLADMIAQWERNRAGTERDAAKAAKKATYEAERRYEAMRNKATENLQYKIRDLMSPITTMSLGAGRWRQEMYERAGFRDHIGN